MHLGLNGLLQKKESPNLPSFFFSFVIRHVFHITEDLAALAIQVNKSYSHPTRSSGQTASLHHSCFTERGPRRLHPQRRPDSNRQSDFPFLDLQNFRLTSASSMALSFQSPPLNSAPLPSSPPCRSPASLDPKSQMCTWAMSSKLPLDNHPLGRPPCLPASHLP